MVQIVLRLVVAVSLAGMCIASSPVTAVQTVTKRPQMDYLVALDTLMPLNEPLPMPRDAQWVLRVRVREPGAPELWFRLQRNYSKEDASVANVAQVLAPGLQEQMSRLEKRGLSVNVRTLRSHIVVNRWAVKKCPMLDAAAVDIGQLSVPFILDDTIELDGPVYEFDGLFQSGWLRGEISGAESAQAVVRTIHQISDALIRCRAN